MSEELKPVRCGCGGEAIILKADKYHQFPDTYYVSCTKCTAGVGPYDTEAEAITAWNRAMGTNTRRLLEVLVHDATDSNVGDKERTAKVINRRYNGTALGIVGLADSSYGTCDNCWGDVSDRYTYCPRCGAKLDWGK